MNAKIRLLFIAIVVLLLIGCGGGGSSSGGDDGVGGGGGNIPEPPTNVGDGNDNDDDDDDDEQNPDPTIVPTPDPTIVPTPDPTIVPTTEEEEDDHIPTLSQHRSVVDSYRETTDGTGPISVTTYDITGYEGNTHGTRVASTFNGMYGERELDHYDDITDDNIATLTKMSPKEGDNFVNSPAYDIIDPEFGLVEFIRRPDIVRSSFIDPEKTGIHWASNDANPRGNDRKHTVDGRELLVEATATARWWEEKSNRLLLSSLENRTEDAEENNLFCEDVNYLCGVFDDSAAYMGFTSKVVFVGAQRRLHNRLLFWSATNGADDSPYTANTLYVDSPDDSTSHATPVAAAYATIILSQDPDMTPEKLKEHLFAAAELIEKEEAVHITGERRDLYYLTYEGLMDYIEETFPSQ